MGGTNSDSIDTAVVGTSLRAGRTGGLSFGTGGGVSVRGAASGKGSACVTHDVDTEPFRDSRRLAKYKSGYAPGSAFARKSAVSAIALEELCMASIG